jgi:2-iminobutanoate/2-iminopropanoate deaminase
MHKIINDTKAPKAVGTYSQGALVNGVYYFSGQIGLHPITGNMAENFSSQLEQVLSNIDALLKDCGLERKNIFKSTVFLTDLAEFPKVNAAYEKFFTAPYPARSTIEVKGLPKGALVEIEVLATQAN